MGVKLLPYQGLDSGIHIPGWDEMSSFVSDTTLSSSTYLSLVMEGSVSELSGISTPRPFNYVCAYCEGSWQVPAGFQKSSEMKMLEDIASDHFKKRVLRAEEISLNDTMSIADDIDRCVQLLNSVVLCDSCIYKFSSNEAKILMAQEEYLKRMTGPREFGDLLGDPWLDLKRYAYAKLKNQQASITEKLSLINKSIPRDLPSTSTSASGAATALLGLGLPGTGTSETIMQQVLVPPLKYPPSSTSTISVDVSTIDDHVTCQFAVSSEASNSSGASSPVGVGQGRETRTSVQSPSDYESAEDHIGNVEPQNAVPPTVKPKPKPSKNEGSSVSTMIVPPAVSPVVNLRPISISTSQDQSASELGKAPETSSSSTNQQGGKKVARQLTKGLEEVDAASVVAVSKGKKLDGHEGVNKGNESSDSDSSDDDDDNKQKKSTNSARRKQPAEDENKNDGGIARFQPLRVETPIKPAHLQGPASLAAPPRPPSSKRGRGRGSSSMPIAGPRPYTGSAMEEDEDGFSSDGNSSMKSSASTRSTRSKNSPAKLRKNFEKEDTPSAKRSKLDIDSVLKKTSMHKTSTPAVFAKKSAPPPITASPVAKRSPRKPATATPKVKLPAPAATSTPKDDPKNKASNKAAKATSVDVDGNKSETERNAPTKAASQEPEKGGEEPAKAIIKGKSIPAAESRTPLPKLPKSKSKSPDKNDRKGKVIGNRVLHDDSGSSDDPESDSDDDTDSD